MPRSNGTAARIDRSKAVEGYGKVISFTLFHDERPFTTNAERKLVPMQRARLVKTWREAFGWLAIAGKAPRGLVEVRVMVTPYYANRRGISDVGAVLPSAKAAIDGLVDVGVMEDDHPGILRQMIFEAPIIGDREGLELQIHGRIRK